MFKKLKSWLANDAYFMALLLILVGVSSFGLGRLSVLESRTSQTGSTALQSLPALAPMDQTAAVGKVQGTPVVVSRSGSKYHLFDCPGAQQIKPENRIEFSDSTAAEAAGYGPAGNCPELAN